MSAALDARPILPRLRAAGADAVLRDDRPVLQRASHVPPALMAEARARCDDLLVELRAEADIDAAAEAEERAAIVAEGEHAEPMAPVLHFLPVSWADPDIVPTPGARCRNCNGRRWWTEATAQRGWRCSTCHPGTHLTREQRRCVVT